jgi:hypothetical protein
VRTRATATPTSRRAGCRGHVRIQDEEHLPGSRARRIATRRGPVRAVVAIERTILTAVWNMLTHHTTYAELGGDYYARRDPMRANSRQVRP